MKYRLHTDKKGALTVEAAVILPFMIAVFIVCFALIDSYLAYNCASKAMYNTAKAMSEYAVLYHTNGIEKLTNAIKEKAGDGINLGKVSEYINTDTVLRFGTDKLYGFAAEKIFQSNIENDDTYNRYFKNRLKWKFSKSDFYHGNNDISLTGEFTCDYDIPFLGGLIKGIRFKKNVLVAAFTDGKATEGIGENGDSVWNLSNFERGKKIEELFGGNLPHFFPVADYYDNGMIMSILSINHTKQTYQSPAALKKTLEDFAQKVYNFNGGEYKGTVIPEGSVIAREIKLVFPEDDFTPAQESVINSFIQKANGMGIRVTVERYQKTVQIDTEK